MAKRHIPIADRVKPRQTWFEKVRLALDTTPSKLAAVMGMELEEIYELCKSGRFIEAGENYEAYEALIEYINERIGMAIAVRNDLQQKLQKDRQTRMLLRDRMRGNVTATTDKS